MARRVAGVRWVALDGPSRRGQDPDAPFARSDAGRDGLSLAHLDDVSALLARAGERTALAIPADATAAWLYAALVVAGERRGIEPAELSGAIRNDIVVSRILGREASPLDAGFAVEIASDLLASALDRTPGVTPAVVPVDRLVAAGAPAPLAIAVGLAAAGLLLERSRARLDSRERHRLAGRIAFAWTPRAGTDAGADALARAWAGIVGEATGRPLARVLFLSSSRHDAGELKTRLVRSVGSGILERVEAELEWIDGKGGVLAAAPAIRTRLVAPDPPLPIPAVGALWREPLAPVELAQRLRERKAERDPGELRASCKELEAGVRLGANVVTATIDAVRSGVTLGEWATWLREHASESRRAAA